MIVLIVVFLLLIGAIPTWPHSRSWGYGPSGGLDFGADRHGHPGLAWKDLTSLVVRGFLKAFGCHRFA